MNAKKIRLTLHFAVVALALLALTACDPFAKEKAEQAEKTRIECLDKICPGNGDVEPKRDHMKDALLRLNGQWYLGPKEYFASGSGAAFYWPSKTPFTGKADGQPWPEQRQPYPDVAIEIFFTGRQSWPTPNVEKPWEGMPWTKRIERMEADGFRIERTKVSPELDVVRFKRADGKLYDAEFYIATQEKRIRGIEPPVLACTISVPPHAEDSCKSGEYWQPDVYADFRFRAKHATDWPAIHQEIIRVLNLAKKAQP